MINLMDGVQLSCALEQRDVISFHSEVDGCQHVELLTSAASFCFGLRPKLQVSEQE